MIPKGSIAILATLNTKGAEVASMRGLLETLGYSATVIDIAPLGPPAIRADLANDEVARQGGWKLAELVRTGQRHRIMEVMGNGAGKLLPIFFSRSGSPGPSGWGQPGYGGLAMAMRALPFGFPRSRLHGGLGAYPPLRGYRTWGLSFGVTSRAGSIR